MPTLLNRLVRAVGLAVALVLAGTALVLGWDWLKVVGPPRLYPRYLAIGFLEAFLAGYFVVLMAAALAVVISGMVVWRSRSRVNTGSLAAFVWVNRSWAGLGGGVAAAVWLSWIHRLPSLPHQFARPASPLDEILIVVIGGSSASGRPLRRLALRRDDRRSRATKSDTVTSLPSQDPGREGGHAGGNAPEARPFDRGGPTHSSFSPDTTSFSLGFLGRTAWRTILTNGHLGMAETWLERAGRFSPLYTLVRENLEKHRVSVIPRAVVRRHGNDRRPPCLYAGRSKMQSWRTFTAVSKRSSPTASGSAACRS